ncbi:MAG: isoprenylcysteine carboxylmethyltransferase family protein [Oscillospiraceae bacterium]|nr:isoprenylcysteine carboxylmethyltransferase family protein [Oscillospiraceae bacterium]
MTTKLLVQATVKFLSGIVLTASLIFLPAGTFLFPNGWLLMAVMFFPMLLAGIFLFLKRPQLLQKRLNTKETQKEQYDLIKLSALMFLSGFVTAGLDFRFGWSALPHSVSLTAAAIFLASYVLYAEVLRENAYLSRTIEVQENQTLVDTGLYALVRHPMYSASVLMFLSIPLILGSLCAFLIFLTYPFLIVKRIKAEESFLEKELPGYSEYKTKVLYRLIPYIW